MLLCNTSHLHFHFPLHQNSFFRDMWKTEEQKLIDASESGSVSEKWNCINASILDLFISSQVVFFMILFLLPEPISISMLRSSSFQSIASSSFQLLFLVVNENVLRIHILGIFVSSWSVIISCWVFSSAALRARIMGLLTTFNFNTMDCIWGFR